MEWLQRSREWVLSANVENGCCTANIQRLPIIQDCSVSSRLLTTSLNSLEGPTWPTFQLLLPPPHYLSLPSLLTVKGPWWCTHSSWTHRVQSCSGLLHRQFPPPRTPSPQMAALLALSHFTSLLFLHPLYCTLTPKSNARMVSPSHLALSFIYGTYYILTDLLAHLSDLLSFTWIYCKIINSRKARNLFYLLTHCKQMINIY